MQSQNDFDFDLLIDMAITGAEVETGIDPARIALHSNMNPALFGGVIQDLHKKAPRWSRDELDFLRKNHDKLCDPEIAEHLGRSLVAIHIKRVRTGLPAVSTAKTEYVTAHQAARMLNIDAHKICYWVDQGFLRGHEQPGKRKIRLIRIVTLYAWATNIENWIYFDPYKVNDPHLARLIQLRAERWGDEWWTTVQVARYHNVEVKDDVRRYILTGDLKATQIKYSRGGAQPGRWLGQLVRAEE